MAKNSIVIFWKSACPMCGSRVRVMIRRLKIVVLFLEVLALVSGSGVMVQDYEGKLDAKK